MRVPLDAAAAFEVFTARIGLWWPRSRSIGRVPQQDVVLEPRVNGRWYERGIDGSECEWGKVLAWEPPARVLLAWQINADFEYDRELVTEVEVRFVAEGAKSTRVELEHRGLERVGVRAGTLRSRFDSPQGWSGVLERYVEAASSA